MQFINKMRKKDKGFTLVEIIVVLVILAILAAFMIPAMLGFVGDAKSKALVAEAREVYVAGQASLTEYNATNAAKHADGALANTATSDKVVIKMNSYLGSDITGTWTVTIAGDKVTKVVYARDSQTYTLEPGKS